MIELKEMEAFVRSKHFDVEELCRKIKNCKGKIFLTGVGKSGHIANKISATFQAQVHHLFLYILQKHYMGSGHDREKRCHISNIKIW